MNSENAARVVDAKLIMDKVIYGNDLHGYLSEVGIDAHDAYDAWMGIDEIIRAEGLSYDMASGDVSEDTVEHWTEVDGALKQVRELLGEIDGEDREACESELSSIEGKFERFGIGY